MSISWELPRGSLAEPRDSCRPSVCRRVRTRTSPTRPAIRSRHTRSRRTHTQRAATRSRRPMARLVLNHSTHCEGLIPVLRRLASLLPEGSVIPARISVARAAADRSLRLHVSGPGGGRDSFRLLAKRGTVIQEVFIRTPLEIEEVRLITAAAVKGKG